MSDRCPLGACDGKACPKCGGPVEHHVESNTPQHYRPLEKRLKFACFRCNEWIVPVAKKEAAK